MVDKCLLVILTLLMLQSALNLFINEANSRETSSIDVVIRTSTAGIFGYLISANFNQQRKRKRQKQNSASNTATITAAGTTGDVRNRIGFDSGAADGELSTAAAPQLAQSDGESHNRYDKAQVLVVASVCVASLGILLIYRNFFPVSASAVGTLTQFRDFVSGSVGFLISCSTSGSGVETD